MALEVLIESHVRERREALGLALRTMADAVGLKKSYVSNAETGLTDWRVSQIQRLAEYLQCHPLELISFPGFPGLCPCQLKEGAPNDDLTG